MMIGIMALRIAVTIIDTSLFEVPCFLIVRTLKNPTDNPPITTNNVGNSQSLDKVLVVIQII